jgi:hypothetical protein
MIHEALPLLGISEAIAIAVYAILVLTYLVAFLPVVLKSNYVVLALALVCFTLSAALDIWRPGWVFREDSAKLLGLLLWLAYFTSFAISSIKAQALEQIER